MIETNLTREQVENIQIDHGILIKNYGLENQQILAPLRGGTNFKVERTYRDIEFDGKKGRTKGLKTIDEENATLTAKTLNTSLEVLADKLPGATITKDNVTQKVTKIEGGNIGLISEDDYITNITMFAQKIDGKYIKVTIFNALDESGLDFSAVQKTEGEIELVYNAHYKYNESSKPYSIENVNNINYVEEG